MRRLTGPTSRSFRQVPRVRRTHGGAILLEVVLSLAMFCVTAGVVFSGLSASYDTASRMKSQALAGDLAVTKLSEITMGEVELADKGPVEYDQADLAGWSWEVAVAPMELTNVLMADKEVQVKVTIRQAESGLVYRLVCLMPSPGTSSEQDSLEDPYSGGLP